MRKPIQIRLSDQERQASSLAAYWQNETLSEFTRKALAEKSQRTFRVEMRDSEMLVFFQDSNNVNDDGSMSVDMIRYLTDTLAAFDYPADWVCTDVNKIAHNFFCARFEPEQN